MSLALLFPGQASQAVGMGVDLRAASAEAGRLFALADEATGLPITALGEAGPLDRLTATDVAQPAVVVTSLAALAFLSERAGERLRYAAVAGHSVGELAACVAAGALEPSLALALVSTRAKAMAAACALVDGTMAAVLGLEEEPLRDVCRQASGPDGSVDLANLNAPGQLVISGERRAVERAGQLAREAGARRVLPLNVGGPFHSTYMHPAVDAMTAALGAADLVDARVPLVANVSARSVMTAAEIRSELAQQLAAPVRWADSLRKLSELGCDRFVEVGPGQVLAGLVKRTLPGARVASLGAPSDADAALALL